MSYNPIPPRVWSRVENPCVYIEPGSQYTQAYIPLTSQTVSLAQAEYEMKQISKGNVLQYKSNSARLTKSQKYSQLARMVGPNRTKVFATQSETYTNPNIKGLLRIGYITYPFPNEIVGKPNYISGPFSYGIADPNNCSFNSIKDGGTLICGTYSNPCSDEVYKEPSFTSVICNSASSSNVPGPYILCWNNKLQSWFPKKRYTMSNSTNKWPINYKGFVSASNSIITLSGDVSGNVVYLSWFEQKSCYPVDNYNIYVNNILYVSLPSNLNSYNFTETKGNYNIYVRSVNNQILSQPSNLVNVIVN